jgi:hypothetical protein
MPVDGRKFGAFELAVETGEKQPDLRRAAKFLNEFVGLENAEEEAAIDSSIVGLAEVVLDTIVKDAREVSG